MQNETSDRLSNGQRTRPQYRIPEFEPRWCLQFFCKIVVEKDESKTKKEAEVGHRVHTYSFGFKERLQGAIDDRLIDGSTKVEEINVRVELKRVPKIGRSE